MEQVKREQKYLKKYMEILPNIMENLGPHSINSKQIKKKKTKTVPDMVASSFLPGRADF